MRRHRCRARRQVIGEIPRAFITLAVSNVWPSPRAAAAMPERHNFTIDHHRVDIAGLSSRPWN
jgi:hypothetical protein